ncbi:MAG: hypothetical protein KF758_05345 [Anaerolineales bacterium]|nr:hypothetical protein [Anaerolineales bacterium]
MNQKLRNEIYKNLDIKETEELLEIWQTNDRVEWSELSFEVLEEILKQRKIKKPKQNEPITEYQEEDIRDENLEDWEAKLLDKEEQPEFYDVLEVLSLKDNVNKVAKAAVIIIIVTRLLSSFVIQSLLVGKMPPFDINIFLPFFITILRTGLDVALVYFSLQALAYILRILMEMEFNSRNAK